MFVVDTNVVSELRKTPFGNADKNVVAWARRIGGASLFISVITLMEIEIGILRLERRDARQGRALRAWLDGQVRDVFKDRTLSVDAAVASRCAELHVPNPRSERDALIAATAVAHGMTVATRNVGDFEGTGVQVVNPWLAPAG